MGGLQLHQSTAETAFPSPVPEADTPADTNPSWPMESTSVAGAIEDSRVL